MALSGRQRQPRSQSRPAVAVGGSFLVKRAIDIFVSLCCLTLFAPLLLAAAAWIKLVDGGPVLYSQWRVGHEGWLFRIYKLRTMYLNAEDTGVQFAADRDPRVLPLCDLIRKTHIDELPQLWNILCGEMSLVGPRPERPEMIEQLRGALPHIEKRLACPPGLTGLAQVRNGYTNDIEGARRKLAYDLRYLQSRSTLGDLRLLVATVPKFWDHAAL